MLYTNTHSDMDLLLLVKSTIIFVSLACTEISDKQKFQLRNVCVCVCAFMHVCMFVNLFVSSFLFFAQLVIF